MKDFSFSTFRARLPPGTLDADVRILMEFTGEASRRLTIEAPGEFLDALEGSAQ